MSTFEDNRKIATAGRGGPNGRRQRLLLVVVPLLAVGLIAAGCGDDGEPEASDDVAPIASK